MLKLAEKVRDILHLANLKDSIIRATIFTENNSLKNVFESEGNIIIKNLPENLTPKELCDIFQNIGKIISIKLKQGANGKCLGYGYVQFSSNEEAFKAIESLNKTYIQGKQIIVEKFSKNRKAIINNTEENTNNNIVFIQQLPFQVINRK